MDAPTAPLRDRFGRTFDYLRIAVTDVCNLRCLYCMPEEGVNFTPSERLLRAEEILRVVRVLAPLGVSKIRFTGGEPLVRKDIVSLVAGTASTEGIRSVHLTTNGLLLGTLAEPLRRAGLTGLNVSLDTLRPDRFQRITRRAGVERVLEGLRHALELGFPSVKVNAVAMRDFNDDELPEFAELTRQKGVTVRFIELMPFDSHQIWKTGHFVSAERLVERFLASFPQAARDEGSSTEEHIFRIPGYAGKVAFIPSYTRTLCGDCTRIRLTADGQIRNCLYSEEEYDLMSALRNGASDADLADIVRRAMREKLEDGWAAQRQARARAEEHPGQARDSMTQIGG